MSFKIIKFLSETFFNIINNFKNISNFRFYICILIFILYTCQMFKKYIFFKFVLKICKLYGAL